MSRELGEVGYGHHQFGVNLVEAIVPLVGVGVEGALEDFDGGVVVEDVEGAVGAGLAIDNDDAAAHWRG